MSKEGIKYILTSVIVLAVVVTLGFALSKNQETQKETAKSTNALESMIGQPMPNIQLKDKDGKTFTGESFKGKNTVLFFSEGIMCYPACWDEIVDLAADTRLNNPDTAVYSVVIDSAEQWVTAKQKMPELDKAMMLFDQNSVVSRQLGVNSLPSSMHMGAMPGHTYIVLDKEGIVRYVFDDPRMAKNGELIVKEIEKLIN